MNEPLYVEVSALLSRHLTGIGRFVARLIEALAHEAPLRLTTTMDRETARNLDLSTRLCRGSDVPLTLDLLPRADDARSWVDRLLELPQERHDPERSRHSPILYTTLRPGVRHFRRELCILYDFTPLLTPQFHTAQTRQSYGAFFSEATALCDAAIAISESTRSDAAWLAGIDPSRVFAHHPGPSQCVHRHASGSPVKRRDDLILVVATLEPRKNAQFVLDWFLSTRLLPAGTRLCWVGPPGWLPALGSRPSGDAARRIDFAGIVSDAELCRLYQEATFTIYPSLYEGFGLPVLDSLWHDCPVLSSYHSSLTEFETPGVFHFDPCDTATLDEACAELLAARDETSIDRKELARRYSWREMARAVMRLAFEAEAKPRLTACGFASSDTSIQL